MPILMRHEAPGMTASQSESLMAPLFDQLKSFPGFITHVSGAIPGGYQVTEVWESQEGHERWLREVVIPSLQRAGFDQPLPPPRYESLDHVIAR